MLDGANAAKWIVKELEWNFKPRILDIGCGSGSTALNLLPHALEIVAIDKSPDVTLLNSSQYPHFKAVCADATEPLDNLGEFDVCTIVGVLHHVSDINLVLQRCLNALKINGQIVVLELQPCNESKCKGVASSALGSALRGTGFKDLKVSRGRYVSETTSLGVKIRRIAYIVTGTR